MTTSSTMGKSLHPPIPRTAKQGSEICLVVNQTPKKVFEDGIGRGNGRNTVSKNLRKALIHQVP